jgi:hypothetical protein
MSALLRTSFTNSPGCCRLCTVVDITARKRVGSVLLFYCSVSIGRFITMACSFFMVSR